MEGFRFSGALKAKEATKEYRQAVISRLMLERKTANAIWLLLRERFGIKTAKKTVNKDIEEIRTRWIESINYNVGEQLAEELDFLRQVRGEAITAYYRTVEEAKVRTTEKWSDERGEERSTITEQTVGDPRFLDAALRTSDQIRKLLGLDAPDTASQYQGDEGFEAWVKRNHSKRFGDSKTS